MGIPAQERADTVVVMHVYRLQSYGMSAVSHSHRRGPFGTYACTLPVEVSTQERAVLHKAWYGSQQPTREDCLACMYYSGSAEQEGG
jgi:hypothetical protein